LIVLIANAHRLLDLAKLVLLACARRAARSDHTDTQECAARLLPYPCKNTRTSGPGLPFTTQAANNAIDVFDMVLPEVTPSDFEAMS
jgi:hypothetical protein